MTNHFSTLAAWSIAVGSVISGDFFGWQFTLSFGMFGACCFILPIFWLYLCVTLCLNELVNLMREKGKHDTLFTSEILNLFCGFLMANAELLKVVIVTCVVNTGLSDYLEIDKDWQRFIFWFSIYFYSFF
eukprot:UN27034